jgi:hypothetical protein
VRGELRLGSPSETGVEQPEFPLSASGAVIVGPLMARSAGSMTEAGRCREEESPASVAVVEPLRNKSVLGLLFPGGTRSHTVTVIRAPDHRPISVIYTYLLVLGFRDLNIQALNCYFCPTRTLK